MNKWIGIVVISLVIIAVVYVCYTMVNQNDESKFYGEWKYDYVKDELPLSLTLTFYDNGTCIMDDQGRWYFSNVNYYVKWSWSKGSFADYQDIDIITFDPYIEMPDDSTHSKVGCKFYTSPGIFVMYGENGIGYVFHS